MPPAHASRVLPAHLESNFINPVFRGAQPAGCLRAPTRVPPLSAWSESATAAASAAAAGDDFTSDDILREIERARPDVGIVTVASEIDGGLELIQWLVARRYLVSLGHSAATYEQAIDAIAAGARQATHLFNRMPPLGHRAPGLAGAVLQSDEIAAELICDGFHVHPALVRTAVAAKRPLRAFA